MLESKSPFEQNVEKLGSKDQTWTQGRDARVLDCLNGRWVVRDMVM